MEGLMKIVLVWGTRPKFKNIDVMVFVSQRPATARALSG